MFLETYAMESTNFFVGIKKQSQVICKKNNFGSDLLGSQHLFEILQTFITFKNSENVVKSGCFENLSRDQETRFYL